MRIVLTSNFSPWSAYSGGGQRSTHELATALAQQGHDVNVVFTRPPWERFATPPTEYALHWAVFFDFASRRPAPLRPLNAWSVSRVIRRMHALTPIDALHGNGEEVALAARWASARKITVVTTPRYPNYPAAMLQPDSVTHLGWLRLLATDAKYLVLRQAVRSSSWCCPTSRHSAEQAVLALNADRSRLRVIPNGVAAQFFAAKWTPSSEHRPLLFFGRLAKDKGVDVLLRALSRLSPAHRLVVIGRGEEKAALKRLASELGVEERISWRPWLSEAALATELSHCSMAVLPSRHESFGNAMAEAMAVGAPLVSTRVGSIPEVVQDGITGLLVPADDPEALARAIQRLTAAPELSHSLSSAGRERTQASYTWGAVARSYAELYDQHPPARMN